MRQEIHVKSHGIRENLMGWQSVWRLSLSVLVTLPGVVFGQNFPAKSIRMVTAEAGGSTDFIARQIAQGIAGGLGQQVVVDNRGGGGGLIAAETVVRASPDGYTLLFYGSSLWIGPLLRDKTPFDVLRDFSPIALTASSPNILVVNHSVAAGSVRELIVLARARPGELNYSSGSSGASTHLAAELLKSMAGINIVRIAYKGAGPALNAVIAGEVQLMFSIAASVAPLAKSGKLKALAVTSSAPSVLAPGLPTVAASGLPGFESAFLGAVFGPAKIPAAIINRLNYDIVQLLGRADVKEKMLGIGVEATGSSPQQLASTVRSEIERLGKVIKDAGIRAE